jgi:pimeloyl-ACP methyl ester carboxylesterase
VRFRGFGLDVALLARCDPIAAWLRSKRKKGTFVSERLEESGSPGSPTVVLLHGGGLGAWSWRRHLGMLAPAFHCLAPELPGHGADGGTPFTFERGIDQVARLIQDRATGGVAHLAGLSLGGQLALAVAARHRSLVDRVIVTGANVSGIPFARAALWITRPFLGLKNSAAIARLSARQMHVPADETADFIAASRAVTYRSLAAIVLESAAFRVPPGLDGFDRAVLILAGQKELRLVLGSADRLRAVLPNAEVRIVPDQDHAWPLQDPALFADTVRAWVDGRPLPSMLMSR